MSILYVDPPFKGLPIRPHCIVKSLYKLTTWTGIWIATLLCQRISSVLSFPSNRNIVAVKCVLQVRIPSAWKLQSGELGDEFKRKTWRHREKVGDLCDILLVLKTRVHPNVKHHEYPKSVQYLKINHEILWFFSSWGKKIHQTRILTTWKEFLSTTEAREKKSWFFQDFGGKFAYSIFNHSHFPPWHFKIFFQLFQKRKNADSCIL